MSVLRLAELQLNGVSVLDIADAKAAVTTEQIYISGRKIKIINKKEWQHQNKKAENIWQQKWKKKL